MFENQNQAASAKSATEAPAFQRAMERISKEANELEAILGGLRVITDRVTGNGPDPIDQPTEATAPMRSGLAGMLEDHADRLHLANNKFSNLVEQLRGQV